MWSIQEVARRAGVTSRTLRHYDDLGLVPPATVGSNGYRYYDDAALVRLQRVLLLRDLGLGLTEIARVLDREVAETTALRDHLRWLRAERDRLERQAASVTRTLTALEEGTPMTEDMFDGFDHTRYREEVEQRWGADAYATGDRWWRGMSEQQRAAWSERAATLGADWLAAAAEGVDPASDRAQQVARRHEEWLTSIPGTPGAGTGQAPAAYLLGLADMYVADPRFAANYGGEDGARFVRDTLREYVARRG